MKYILVLSIFISLISKAQDKIFTIDLSDSGSSLNPDYLTKLDSIFVESKIIGLGESTHGTSEFTIIRAEIFKYLVVNHNYSIFFLEADYNACSRVNRCIQGANDNAKEALMEVGLWPWITQELLDLVEWMRMYNKQHNNVLEFVGCDMQLITDDKKELARYFSMNSKFHDLKSMLPSLDFNTKDSSILKSKHQEWITFSDTFYKSHADEEPLLINSVTQWFENAVFDGYKGNFRDSCMGKNIVDYLERRPTKKGIYFAHNGHVGSISTTFKQNNITYKRAGYFIKEQFGNQYFAIALDFNSGSFNAINYVSDKFVMECFTFRKSKKKSLAHYVLGKENKVKFVPINSISDSKKLNINSIGAIYGKSKSGYKISRFRNFNKENYDAYIIINKGTPTNLLNTM